MLSGQNNPLRGGIKFCSAKVLSLSSVSGKCFENRSIYLGVVLDFVLQELSLASESGKCFQDRTISLRVVLKFVPQKYCHLPVSLGNALRTE